MSDFIEINGKLFRKYTDKTVLKYGKHKGKALANVPAGYLIYCFENNLMPPLVAHYVSENMDVLQKEMREAKTRAGM